MGVLIVVARIADYLNRDSSEKSIQFAGFGSPPFVITQASSHTKPHVSVVE